MARVSAFPYFCVMASIGSGDLQRRPREAIRYVRDGATQTLRPPPLLTDSTMYSIGQQALYAFEAADGTMKLGTREEVSTWLQSRVTELQTTPFVLHDVAEFLGDSGLLSEAQARCDMLLQRSRKTTSVPEVPSVTSGTTRTMKIQWEYDLVETALL